MLDPRNHTSIFTAACSMNQDLAPQARIMDRSDEQLMAMFLGKLAAKHDVPIDSTESIIDELTKILID